MKNSSKLGIIVLGANGRMGQTLIRLLKDKPDMELSCAVDREAYKGETALQCPFFENIAQAVRYAPDAVIIDFSAPDASMGAATIAAEHKISVVIGTTGLDENQRARLAELATQTPILFSPNMGVGINVLSDILPVMARELGSAFDQEVVEVHHRMKKDAPSGTALMLADGLARANGWNGDDVFTFSRHGQIGARPDREIGIQTVRGGDVAGIHTVYFLGPGEYIKIEHVAESRDTFANGALRAAKWLHGKKAGKLYSMHDVVTESADTQ